MPASAPKATLSTPPTCPHLSSGLVRKGHLRSARTWGCGGFCPQIPPCVGQEPLGWAGLCAPTTRLPPGPPAGAPFSPSVRSTYEGLFLRLHLRRHERGVCEITAATQTARHTGHGGGGLPALGRAVPSKPPLSRGPGRPPSPRRPNTRPKQPKMIRLFDPEPKAFPGRTSRAPEKALGEEPSPRPATALALRAGVLLRPGPQEGGLLSPCQSD